MSVYDEKCKTTYPAKCVKEEQCTMVYRTMCDMEGFAQNCRQVPSQTCVPVTKCHRTPKTQCKPIKDKECGNVEVQVPTREMKYKCQPFEPRKEENLDACMGMMAGNDMRAPPIQTGYGAPGSVPNYSGTPNSAGTAQQVPATKYTSLPQTYNNNNVNLGQNSQPLQNTYASNSQNNLNAPATQSFAQTVTSNNNYNNNNIASQAFNTGAQPQQQQQPPNNALNAPSSFNNYNTGTSVPVVQQQEMFLFNQQPLSNTYSSGDSISQTPILTPQSQLQQPFGGSIGNSQSYSAPSTFTSPLSSNYIIQTPFAPGINSNSNNEGDLILPFAFKFLLTSLAD